jgi:hypothetical protein
MHLLLRLHRPPPSAAFHTAWCSLLSFPNMLEGDSNVEAKFFRGVNGEPLRSLGNPAAEEHFPCTVDA